MLKWRKQKLLILFCGIILSGVDAQENLAELPNIILLLADDLGYNDLKCYGGHAQTPNLDQLAATGIRFTDFYAAAPNCSPSRAGLLTGRSPSKVGVYNYLSPGHPMHLLASEITLAEALKQKNYHTGHFGKWHLSCLPQNDSLMQPQPDDQGFDFSFGTANNAQPSHLNPVNFVRNGSPVGELQGYSCDLVVNESIAWLDTLSNSKNPFFAYLAFHEPHKKVASPPHLVRNYRDYGSKDAEYLANIENLDQAIGRLLDFLEEKGFLNNTLIIFSSDNGSYRNGSNDPLLGGKSFVYEGGIRVPGIFSWQGRISEAQIVSEPVGLIDLMPTLLDLCGIQHLHRRHLDGTSLVPILLKKPFKRKKPLSWFFYRTSPEMAMRINNYVILGSDLDTTVVTHSMTAPDMPYVKTMTLDQFELYDLKKDISQLHDLYGQMPETRRFRRHLKKRLAEIQRTGHTWTNLPSPTGVKRLKSEWRQLRPDGFSN